MQRRIHIVEEVVDMPNHYAHDLVLGDSPVHNETEPHQHPREVWRREHQQPEEAELRIGVAPRPDVHERRRERVAQEGHRHERREQDQTRGGVEEQPREVRGGPAGRFLEEARVALHEVDLEEEVEGERVEEEEGGGEAPVLRGKGLACCGPSG